MCCGKMIRLPTNKERNIITTRNIAVNLDKERRETKMPPNEKKPKPKIHPLDTGG